jgi:hypothetical protein
MAWVCCNAHTCDEGAHYMTWSHVTRWRILRQCLASMGRLQVSRASQRLGATHRTWRWSLGNDLALMDKGNGEELARLRSMNQRSRDDMKWIISFGDVGWCLCCINIGDRMECVRQRYNCRAFHFCWSKVV